MRLTVTRGDEVASFDVDTVDDPDFERWCRTVTMMSEHIHAACPKILDDTVGRMLAAVSEIADAFDVECRIDTHSAGQREQVEALPLEDAFVTVRVRL
ncbi:MULTISPECIES: hypothetical protein [Prauserella salsuginis group]|uniref:Uncharacterized protein n=1 Tax=Prauserella salsuginis TaxID=387889 RepID=A0ABW6G061_9PSEU|nr:MULTISPECIES: hypothetical protein [Prauserella salsuginis group]MCR3721203.1 hypothetical protein [Prauserella flava]MCR3734716.1 hypothetical protein [Prauserella salsuginis]